MERPIYREIRMAYALKRRETVEQSLRRIADELLDKALRDLRRPGAAHSARKTCKKMRALLRLVRKHFGSEFRSENRRFRDFARKLSGVRDAEAVLESWRDLVDHGPGGLSDAQIERISNGLAERSQRLRSRPGPDPADLTAELNEARKRARGWRVHGRGFDPIADGLGAAYRRARAMQRRARAHPHTAVIHEWRKRVKDHWYHMRLIDSAWPAELKPRTDALALLAEDLGRVHDLGLLPPALDDLDLDPLDRVEVDELIAGHTETLIDSCFARATHLFAEKPTRFVGRMRAHYELWTSPDVKTRE